MWLVCRRRRHRLSLSLSLSLSISRPFLDSPLLSMKERERERERERETVSHVRFAGHQRKKERKIPLLLGRDGGARASMMFASPSSCLAGCLASVGRSVVWHHQIVMSLMAH
jgi:hypothetical protein